MLHSPFDDVEIPDVALTPFVLEHAATRADAPALIDGPSGRTITYGQLADMVHLVAGGLVARGFEKGDVIGVMLPNMPEYALAFHGPALAGGAATTINPTYTAEEVNHQLTDSAAKSLVTIEMFLETAKEAAKGTAVEEIFVVGEADGATPFASLLSGDRLDRQVPVDPTNDVVVLPYSSGTTGRSKGVMLTHRNLVANLIQTASPIEIASHDAFVAVLPFFHIYGMQVLMNLGLRHGCKVVTVPRFDLEQFLRLNQDERATWAFVVPPMVLALAHHPMVDQFDLTGLKRIFSGAAPLGGEIADAASARVGATVVQGYGMTELSPVSHAFPENFTEKTGSVGQLLPSTEARIVDDAGDDVSLGERGELWIRGPQVMKGYLENAAATAATIDDDGWLHTGDVAVADEDGYYWIVDRLKELIKYKGFQVPPAELEALLITHESIIDVAVIGVPDDEAGELPKAFVVVNPGAELSAADVQEFVAGHVAHYKQIRMVEFIDEIPKSASGKILRRFLRDQT
ncbi:MAG: AMP-binding protein [Acidimicrobiia bacterium]|nr:AMP-binding protein [Acidimicrobiia bacterium]